MTSLLEPQAALQLVEKQVSSAGWVVLKSVLELCLGRATSFEFNWPYVTWIRVLWMFPQAVEKGSHFESYVFLVFQAEYQQGEVCKAQEPY